MICTSPKRNWGLCVQQYRWKVTTNGQLQYATMSAVNDLEVMGLKLSRVELGVSGTSKSYLNNKYN